MLSDEERAIKVFNTVALHDNCVLIDRYGKPSNDDLAAILAAFAALREECAKEKAALIGLSSLVDAVCEGTFGRQYLEAALRAQEAIRTAQPAANPLAAVETRERELEKDI